MRRMKCCPACFGVVDAVGGDDPLEGFVADRQPAAALAPGDAQFQERANPFGVLRVTGLNLFVSNCAVSAAPGWLLEGDAVLLCEAVERTPAQAQGNRCLRLRVCRSQFPNTLGKLVAFLLAYIF